MTTTNTRTTAEVAADLRRLAESLAVTPQLDGVPLPGCAAMLTESARRLERLDRAPVAHQWRYELTIQDADGARALSITVTAANINDAFALAAVEAAHRARVTFSEIVKLQFWARLDA